MTTVSYDPKSNTLIVASDGKPMCGTIGALSLKHFNSIVDNQISILAGNLDKLEAWLANPANLLHEDWSKHNALANNMACKIKQLQSRKNPSEPVLVYNVSLPSNTQYKNVRL
jgi:hypothetical protein